MQIKIKQSRDTRESIIRIDKRIILSTLRIRKIIARTDTADTAILLMHHTQIPNKATPNTIFMLSGE